MKPIIKGQAEEICKIMEEKKAKDIVMIDIGDRSVIADYFVVASGQSDQQVRSICDAVEDEMRKKNLELLRKEGYRDGRWIVMDYADILVHIFHKDERDYYDLERLWVDGDNSVRFEDGAIVQNYSNHEITQ